MSATKKIKRVSLKSFLNAQNDGRVDFVNNIYTDEKGNQHNLANVEFTFHNFVQTDEVSKLQAEIENLKEEIETLKAQ